MRWRSERGRGGDRVEGRTRRVALDDGLTPVARGVVGIGERKPGHGRFVRRAHIVPEAHGVEEQWLRVGGVAIGQANSPSSQGGAGDQRGAVEAGGDKLERVGCSPARSMSPFAISISTCASSSGAR